ncbi:hypothetical protein BGY98DRAFT_1183596 [Russula aff. rugulosa BPL654]|nr:hypothetical protein BGY98DRAFT_1183596 [Russula aff. rugulosa BPL654]
MSGHSLVLSAVRVESAAEYVNDYVDHPDFRLVAAFFLGWVFFSGLRHVWFSAFLRELMWTCKAISDHLRGRTEEPAIFTGSPYDKSARIHGSLHQCKQRDVPVLFMCMAFMLTSLSSFLSLLTFYPKSGQTACTFVIAAAVVTSQVARMFGFLILGLDLSHRVRRQWELHIFWLLLGVGTVLTGASALIGTGQLHTPSTVPTVALCIRKRFLPTSLASSILNLVLELYIIIRSLSLMQPPRMKPTIVQNARVVQAGSLLLFDLLVVVPNTTYTALVTEFVPFSVGALGVLAAFNSSFGHSDFVEFIPTSAELHTSRSPHPSPAICALKDSTQQGDMSERVISISAIAGPNLDIEAYVPPSSNPGATRGYSMIPFDRHHDETLPTPSPQPYQVSTQTPPEAQPEPINPLRREKILSFSNPVWATFGAPLDKGSRASIHSETSIDDMGSPISNDHSHERSTKFLSATSTILGSDIIRRTTLNKGKDRMKIRYSIPNHSLSPTPSAPSSWRRAVHYSWLSRAPTRGAIFAALNISAELEVETRVQVKWKLQVSKEFEFNTFGEDNRFQVGGGEFLSARMVGSSMDRASLSRPHPSLPRDRAGFVRRPRPPSSF